MKTKGKILIIDDEEDLRKLLVRIFELEKYHIFEASTGKSGLAILKNENIDIVLCDVMLPDINGLDLIPQIKAIGPLIETIMITAYGSIEDGVQAIKYGAFDYITKGDEDSKIIPIAEKALQKVQMAAKINRLEAQLSKKFGFDTLIGSSKALKNAVDMAKKVAETNTPVLLIGETGTGKEIFAQAIHYTSPRKHKPFVAVNCSAFAKQLLESEMFGYKAGAFTGANQHKKGLFEEANEGTFFLDEIADLDIDLQAKLLRAIETQSFIKAGDTKTTEVDVRIIAATNKNLEELIIQNKFREDLYYRIGVMKIEILPLRKRKEDIPLLVDYFVKSYSQKMNRTISQIEHKFIEKLKEYHFPGNIRELRNIIERAIILTTDNVLQTHSLPSEVLFSHRVSESDKVNNSSTLANMEKIHIQKVLDSCQGNKTKAAEILGIGTATLYRKIELYGL
jgi:two-component system NtrC family response regulator